MSRLNASPLDLHVEEGELFLDGQEMRHQVRLLAEMAPVLEDENVLRGLDKGCPAYFMYDEAYPLEPESGLRYGLTALPPGSLGREYRKTMGHYHAVLNRGIAFPELYQVLFGEAIFMLQRRTQNGELDKAMAVQVKEGDLLWIPSAWGHVSINPGETVLVFCDLVSLSCSPDYSVYIEKHGAIYRALNDRTFEKNENYQEDLELQIRDASTRATIEEITEGTPLPQDMVEFILSKEHILCRYLEDPKLFHGLTQPG